MFRSTARYWREIPRRYRGEAAKSAKTGKVFFPARMVEPGNGNRKFKPTKLEYTGEILTYTVIRVAPMGFEKLSPYALAIIALDGGGRITCQVADCDVESVKIGMKVIVEFRKIMDEGNEGLHLYGYKVVPV